MDLILPYKIGDLAESKTFEEGYRGAWFRCKINDMRVAEGHLECYLEYIDYPAENNEWIRLFQKNPACSKQQSSDEIMIRPSFPQWHWKDKVPEPLPNNEVIAIVDDNWKVGDMVDWFSQGCYWSGKITSLLNKDMVRVKLLEPPIGEGQRYDANINDLRPNLDWSLTTDWTVPLSQARGKSWHVVRLIHHKSAAALIKFQRQKAKDVMIRKMIEKENRARERQKKREAYVARGLNLNTLSTQTSEEEDEGEEDDEEVVNERVIASDDDGDGDGGHAVAPSIGASFAPVILAQGSSLVARVAAQPEVKTAANDPTPSAGCGTSEVAYVAGPSASTGFGVEEGGVPAVPQASTPELTAIEPPPQQVERAVEEVAAAPPPERVELAVTETVAVDAGAVTVPTSTVVAPLASGPAATAPSKRGRDAESAGYAPVSKRRIVNMRRPAPPVTLKKSLTPKASRTARAQAAAASTGTGSVSTDVAGGGSSAGATVLVRRSTPSAPTAIDLVADERTRLRQGLGPLSSSFVEATNELTRQLNAETSRLLTKLAEARQELSAVRERGSLVEAELKGLRAFVERDSSCVSRAEDALAVAQKERDAATAREATGIETVRRLKASLQYERSEREKAKATARSSAEAATAHLTHLQLLRKEKDALEKRLAESEGALRKEVEEKEALRVVVGRAARELEVELRPEAMLAEQLSALMAAGHERIRRALRFGVRTVFSVFATHYQDLAFEAVSAGFLPGYTAEELKKIWVETHPPADALAARYDEEVLPKERED